MIVRELITRLGIDLDESDVKKTKSAVSSIGNMLKTLGTMFAFREVFGFLAGAANAASDVEQTMSKLQMNFGDSTKGVVEWASEFAKATGASEYQMRDIAATFGSMLVPTLNFDRAKAAEMSTALSGIAYDLAAINNTDPSETMGQLFSAMTGETEAVERLGISIKQAALEEYAHSVGITKKVTAMSVAEKAELIYGKIVRDTKDKVGAAAKESTTYAGKQRRLSAAMRDLHTRVGEFVVGPAGKFVEWLVKGAKAMIEWAKYATNLKAVAIVLGGVMAALAVSMAVANWPILAAAAALGVLYLIVQDLVVMFRGGDSAFGRLLDTLGGAGTAAATVETLKDAWMELKGVINDPSFGDGLRKTFRWMRDQIRLFGRDVRLLGAQIADFVYFIQGFNAIGKAMENYEITPKEAWEQMKVLWASRSAGADAMRKTFADEDIENTISDNLNDRGRDLSRQSNVVINVYGSATPADYEAAKKTAEEVARKQWKGAYDTTNTDTKTSHYRR